MLAAMLMGVGMEISANGRVVGDAHRAKRDMEEREILKILDTIAMDLFVNMRIDEPNRGDGR